jgi:hypothetical protein
MDNEGLNYKLNQGISREVTVSCAFLRDLIKLCKQESYACNEDSCEFFKECKQAEIESRSDLEDK